MVHADGGTLDLKKEYAIQPYSSRFIRGPERMSQNRTVLMSEIVAFLPAPCLLLHNM
jgi:hypothetical protein